jgi:trehalose-phosphatase
MIDQPVVVGGAYVNVTARIPIDRLSGRPLLLMFDVDGTLAPIADHPTLARVPETTRRILASLVERPGVSVALVSGREAHDARQLVGIDRVWTIGNHGAEVMAPGGDLVVNPDVARYAEAVASAALELAPMVEPLAGVYLENKHWTLSVHYRQADPSVRPRLQLSVDRAAADNGLRVMEGKLVYEIRPPVPVDKGTAVYTLARDLGALAPGASLLFAGDDITDEDAFRRLRAQHPEAVTIHVGDRDDTAAEFVLGDPDGVRELLERIATTL